ncbi:MAG: phage Gp37/Gp68 family protein [Bryobacteraceae bacterium]
MSGATKIEWCDRTWNPIIGCSPVHAGCDHCYGARMATRLAANPKTPQYHGLAQGGKWSGELRLVRKELERPLLWQQPCRIFVCSMSDLHHDKVPAGWIKSVFCRIAMAPQHEYVILTKRPANAAKFWNASVPDNVVYGVSICDQPTADEMIPEILKVPARRIIVSAEPLLGAISVSRWLWPVRWHWDAKYSFPEEAKAANAYAELKPQALVGAHCKFLNGVIVGGETGPGARPLHPDWVRSIRDECAEAGVPFFFKSHGEWLHDSLLNGINVVGIYKKHRWPDGSASYRVGKKAAGRTLDGRTHDEWAEVHK